jgi:hypothetical protein
MHFGGHERRRDPENSHVKKTGPHQRAVGDNDAPATFSYSILNLALAASYQ